MPGFHRILFTGEPRFERFTPRLEVNARYRRREPAIRNIWAEHTAGYIDSHGDKDHWRSPGPIGRSPPHAITVADNRITHRCFIARCNRPRYSRELRRKSRTSHRYSSRLIHRSVPDRPPWHFANDTAVLVASGSLASPVREFAFGIPVCGSAWIATGRIAVVEESREMFGPLELKLNYRWTRKM